MLLLTKPVLPPAQVSRAKNQTITYDAEKACSPYFKLMEELRKQVSGRNKLVLVSAFSMPLKPSC